MTLKRQLRRSIATASATALVLGLAFSASGAANAAGPTASGIKADTVDYFADVYADLAPGNVIESVTYERLQYLLEQDGNVPVLIGGPQNVTTQESIGQINAIAQQFGVNKVYHFNPLLDGAAVDVRDSDIPVVAALWTNLTNNYLNRDLDTSFDDPATAPFFFIYNKNRTVDGTEDRIVASISGSFTAGELDDDSRAADFRASVAEVFETVAVPAEGGVRADVLDNSSFEFFSQQANGRHGAQYANATLYGGDILTAEDSDFRIQSITYPELIHILESDGDYVLFFGGTWCHNTRAVIKDLNKQAAAHGIDTVYNFDLRLDGLSGNALHIRDTASPLAHLYGDVVQNYLPNLETQYLIDSVNPNHQVAFYPGGDTSKPLVKAQKLQVPFLAQYNHAAIANGESAPITRTWIQNNDGVLKEYMTEWWFTIGLNGRASGNNAEQSKAFAAEAVAALEVFFAGDPAPTAPAAVAAPSASVSGTAVTVTWSAPADGGSPITEYRVLLNGDTASTVSGSSTSVTLSAVADGTHLVSIIAVNEVGASEASPAVTVTVPGETGGGSDDDSGDGPGGFVTPSVSVRGSFTPGGTITVTGTGFSGVDSDITVEVHSTPVTLGIVQADALGAFTLTTQLPSDLTLGQHAIVISVDGDQLLSQAITVAAATNGSGTTGGVLAQTGASQQQIFWFALLALIAVAGGSALVVRGHKSHTGGDAAVQVKN